MYVCMYACTHVSTEQNNVFQQSMTSQQIKKSEESKQQLSHPQSNLYVVLPKGCEALGAKNGQQLS